MSNNTNNVPPVGKDNGAAAVHQPVADATVDLVDSEGCQTPLGNTQTKAGGSIRERSELEEALELNPDITLLWNMLGTVMLDDELVKVGEDLYTKQQCFERALQVDPENTTAWSNLGEVSAPTPRGPPSKKNSVMNMGSLAVASLDSTASGAGGGGGSASPRKEHCFAKAVEIDPQDAEAWNKLALSLPSNKATIEVADRSYTRHQCFEKALGADACNVSTWCSLGGMAPAKGTLKTTFGTGKDETTVTYTKQQYYERVLDIDPRHPYAWGLLLETIPSSSNNAATTTTIKVGGKEYTRRECVQKALEMEPRNLSAWNSIILTLPQQGLVAVGDQTYTKQQCYEKLLEIDPKRASAWHSLGNELDTNADATVGRLTYTKQQCYEKVVELDSRNAAAWNSLGSEMPKGGSAAISSGGKKGGLAPLKIVRYTKLMCFIKAVEIDPRHGLAWYNTASSFDSDATHVVINGQSYTKAQCLEKVLQIHPRHPSAWGELAQSIPANDSNNAPPSSPEATIVDGVTYSRKQCFEKQLDVKPRTLDAWIGVIDCLQTKGDVATIGDQTYTKQQCYEKLLEIDPKRASDWYSLGNELDTNADATVGRLTYTKQQCYEKVVELDSRNAAAWTDLAIHVAHCDSTTASPAASPPSSPRNPSSPRKGAHSHPLRHHSMSQCFEGALLADITSSTSWYNAGLSLTSPGDTVGADDRRYTKQECFIRAVELNAGNSVAWNALGSTLPRRSEADTTDNNAPVVVVRGKKYNKQQCFEKSVECDPELAAAWNNLGGVLALTGREVIIAKEDKRSFSSRDCIVRALELQPTAIEAWVNAVNSFVSNEEADADVITIQGEAFTQKECVITCLEMSEKGDVGASRGRGGSLFTMWSLLGDLMLEDGDETVVVDEWAHSRQACYEAALDAGFATQLETANTLVKLGDLLALEKVEGEEAAIVAMVNQKLLTKQQCYAKALELDPSNTTTWNNLGVALGSAPEGDERLVSIGDVIFNEQMCYETALGIDPDDAGLWNNLGVVLADSVVSTTQTGDDETPTTTILGEKLTAEQCFDRADSISERNEAGNKSITADE